MILVLILSWNTSITSDYYNFNNSLNTTYTNKKLKCVKYGA